jgi:hypothetical protein
MTRDAILVHGHADHGRHGGLVATERVLEKAIEEMRLLSQLLFISDVLGGAAAADSRVGAHGLDAVRRWFENRDEFSLGYTIVSPVQHPDAHLLARNRSVDVDRFALDLGVGLARQRDVGELEVEFDRSGGSLSSVTPAYAGVLIPGSRSLLDWVPAFAGMT